MKMSLVVLSVCLALLAVLAAGHGVATAQSPQPPGDIDPCDRKFFMPGYIFVPAAVDSDQAETGAGIDPCWDRKFFMQGHAPAPAADIDPCDRKFFTPGHLTDRTTH